jgi:hypothetical protein
MDGTARPLAPRTPVRDKSRKNATLSDARRGGSGRPTSNCARDSDEGAPRQTPADIAPKRAVLNQYLEC